MAFSGEKIGKFSWEDPFLLTEQLNEEERLISETARAFAPVLIWQTGNGPARKAGQVAMLRPTPWKPLIIRLCARWYSTPSPSLPQ